MDVKSEAQAQDAYLLDLGAPALLSPLICDSSPVFLYLS